jgi:hypothetical protein
VRLSDVAIVCSRRIEQPSSEAAAPRSSRTRSWSRPHRCSLDRGVPGASPAPLTRRKQSRAAQIPECRILPMRARATITLPIQHAGAISGRCRYGDHVVTEPVASPVPGIAVDTARRFSLIAGPIRAKNAAEAWSWAPRGLGQGEAVIASDHLKSRFRYEQGISATGHRCLCWAKATTPTSPTSRTRAYAPPRGAAIYNAVSASRHTHWLPTASRCGST